MLLDVLSICVYIYTLSRESAFLCEKRDVYISNFGSNNVKVNIKYPVPDKFKVLHNVKQ